MSHVCAWSARPFLQRVNRQGLASTASVEASLRQTYRPPPRAGFHNVPRLHHPEPANQRYGTANEPPVHLITSRQHNQKERIGQKALPKPESKTSPMPESTGAAREAAKVKAGQVLDQSNKAALQATNPAIASPRAEEKSQDAKPDAPAAQVDAAQEAKDTALNTILSMGPPSADTPAEKPPHLQAPPFVHHFDTFTLVRALQDGGFSEAQAVTIMKSVRGLITDNAELAREGLLSKGDAEMEAYLFSAAGSELRATLRATRQTSQETQRGQRTALQHEVEILAQRIAADTAALKDELKGMLDDRKMGARMQRRDLENHIQELNYKITARLNSEMRGEVEGLRWVLVRRTAMAIVAVAVGALITLKMGKTAERRNEKELSKQIAQRDCPDPVMQPLPEGSILKGLESGGDPSLVSLG